MRQKTTRKAKPSTVKRERAKYRVRNWREYNASLVARGSLTVWLSEEVVAGWRPQPEGPRPRGGQITYSDLAIESLLILRGLLGLPLRAMEGFGASLLEKMGAEVKMPDYSTLSKRGKGLKVNLSRVRRDEPLHVVIDSTGLKIYGEGEWKVRKYGWCKHRTWRCLHLCVNARTHQIEAAALTESVGQDASTGCTLLERLDQPVEAVAADGAYDKQPFYQTCQTLRVSRILIPPRRDARIKQHGNTNRPPLPRDRNLRAIRLMGRPTWKFLSGYHRRSLAEVAVFRFKTIFGDHLQSRTLDNQTSEALLKCKALNIITRLGMPVSYKVA